MQTGYLLYGLMIFGLLGTAHYTGWSFQSVDEVKGVPKTVRDNPGAYRAHYAGRYRYLGGK
ncbi:MAG: hypothetical protein IPM24_02520 [Bryobacterales bacterium]|jgi:hypothetical protein|nr:hypothetical protein [Bryobacterales bacterium]